ncbi:MAG: hypothetical protein ACK4V6_06630 [Microthrixaceae bacterium]
MTPEPDGPADDDCEIEAQLWHQYELSSAISKAWLSPDLTSDHLKAFDDAWDLFVVQPVWREWVREHIVPDAPFLYLAVRPGLPQRRLQKTKKGVSLHVPAVEVFDADREGQLIPYYVGVIHQIYEKWATVSGSPALPKPPIA